MIEIKNVTKKYGDKVALKNVSFNVNDGEIFGIIGLSGAGKSTLVRCINMLEKPTSGEVLIDGVDITKVKKKELLKMRQQIGMIFQNFNLMNQKTVLQNVLFPLSIAKVEKDDAIRRAHELLDVVGIGHKANVYPKELSGGEKQRVAIARALALNPKVILSDEATSALDNESESIVQKAMDNLMKLPISQIQNIKDNETSVDMPYVIKYKNTYQIQDGHHRLSALWAKGAKKAKVKVLDLEKLVK